MVLGVAVSWLVRVGAKRVAKIDAIRIGPEGWVDDLDVFFANFGWVIIVIFVEIFFERVVHSVNGGFAIFVASHSIEVGFLDKE